MTANLYKCGDKTVKPHYLSWSPRLVFSMIGWILLCFFIAPVFYVGPYALCAAINSARWLKKADDEKAARKYVPQQLFLQDTQNNNMGDNIVW